MVGSLMAAQEARGEAAPSPPPVLPPVSRGATPGPPPSPFAMPQQSESNGLGGCSVGPARAPSPPLIRTTAGGSRPASAASLHSLDGSEHAGRAAGSQRCIPRLGPRHSIVSESSAASVTLESVVSQVGAGCCDTWPAQLSHSSICCPSDMPVTSAVPVAPHICVGVRSMKAAFAIFAIPGNNTHQWCAATPHLYSCTWPALGPRSVASSCLAWTRRSTGCGSSTLGLLVRGGCFWAQRIAQCT